MPERLDLDAIRALYCQYRGLDRRMMGVLDGDLLADNVEALVAEVERLRTELTWIATCSVVVSPHTLILQKHAAEALEGTNG